MISIVIPVLNNWNFTKACLQDLQKLTVPNEIIVVDNGSDDKTTQEIVNFEDVIHHRFEENTGFAHACNKGFTIANGKYVLFLNNDVRVRSQHSNWVEPLMKAADGRKLVGPTVGVLTNDFNFVKESDCFIGDDYQYYMSGWNLTALRSVFEDLTLEEYDGPFTEEMGTAYFEDTDLGFRAREQGIGFEIVNVPVHHFGKMTSKKLNTLSLYQPAKMKFIQKWKNRAGKITLKH